MTNIVFVAPFFLQTTLRFVDAAASLAGVRAGLISQDPLEKLPSGLRSKLAAHAPVADALDPDSILQGVRAIERSIGPVERVLGPGSLLKSASLQRIAPPEVNSTFSPFSVQSGAPPSVSGLNVPPPMS